MASKSTKLIASMLAAQVFRSLLRYCSVCAAPKKPASSRRHLKYACEHLQLVQMHYHINQIISIARLMVKSTGHQLHAFACTSSMRCIWIEKWWAEAGHI